MFRFVTDSTGFRYDLRHLTVAVNFQTNKNQQSQPRTIQKCRQLTRKSDTDAQTFSQAQVGLRWTFSPRRFVGMRSPRPSKTRLPPITLPATSLRVHAVALLCNLPHLQLQFRSLTELEMTVLEVAKSKSSAEDFSFFADDSIFDSSSWYKNPVFSPSKTARKAVDSTSLSQPDMKTYSSAASTVDSTTLKIESAALEIESTISEDKCLWQIFTGLDENGDNCVGSAEVMGFLRKLNIEMPYEQVEDAVRSFSAYGLDSLHWEEFVEFCQSVLTEKEETDEYDSAVVKAFNVFDRNGDGLISPTELGDVLWRLGYLEGRDESFCSSLIRSVDFNGDGHVDIAEFRKLMARGSPFTSPAPSPSPSFDSYAEDSL